MLVARCSLYMHVSMYAHYVCMGGGYAWNKQWMHFMLETYFQKSGNNELHLLDLGNQPIRGLPHFVKCSRGHRVVEAVSAHSVMHLQTTYPSHYK